MFLPVGTLHIEGCSQSHLSECVWRHRLECHKTFRSSAKQSHSLHLIQKQRDSWEPDCAPPLASDLHLLWVVADWLFPGLCQLSSASHLVAPLWGQSTEWQALGIIILPYEIRWEGSVLCWRPRVFMGMLFSLRLSFTSPSLPPNSLTPGSAKAHHYKCPAWLWL